MHGGSAGADGQATRLHAPRARWCCRCRLASDAAARATRTVVLPMPTGKRRGCTRHAHGSGALCRPAPAPLARPVRPACMVAGPRVDRVTRIGVRPEDRCAPRGPTRRLSKALLAAQMCVSLIASRRFWLSRWQGSSAWEWMHLLSRDPQWI
eukprot:365626-Chlamydomonas_euryale.AAC.11